MTSISISSLLGTLPSNAYLPGVSGANMPTGTTSDRPISPRPFQIRQNSTLNILELWNPVFSRWETITTNTNNQSYDYGAIGSSATIFIDYGTIP